MSKKPTPRLHALFDRVERVCQNKSALARLLGVSRDHIQKWITARQYEPGGEVTLALLEWVTAEEAKQKQKALGSVITTAKSRKAHATKSSYEKRDTGPRRS
ncbi:MAG TPA: hypothetical protein VH595_22010 [Verrucomicrobiae bacterium]|jgi:DNA-binding transcriptional regulator YdaS (Cro superfamily)|nr:hypothetical protein [Verrucomicrobiae bacterium]